MLNLVLYVSKFYISGILFDSVKETIIDKFFLPIPYNPEFTDSVITAKKLDIFLDHLKGKFSKISEGAIEKKIVVASDLADIKSDIYFKDLISMYGIGIIDLDYYNYPLKNLTQDEEDGLYNSIYYRLDLENEFRIKVDNALFIDRIKDISVSSNDIIISLFPLGKTLEPVYIKEFYKSLSKHLNGINLLSFVFDTNFIAVPLLYSLRLYKIDYNSFISKNNTFIPTSFLFVPEADELKIEHDDRSISVKKNDVLKIDSDQKPLHIEAKSKYGKLNKTYKSLDLNFYILHT